MTAKIDCNLKEKEILRGKSTDKPECKFAK